MSPTVSLANVLSFGHLEKPVRQHLKNVYATLFICMLLASAGAYVHLFLYPAGGILTALMSIGALIALGMTPHNLENQKMRFSYMSCFAIGTGLNLGPLMDIVIDIDQTIIPTAFMSTALIFASFTLASLLSSDRKFLFLGGTLMSGLSMMFFLGILNIFFRSPLLFQVELYLGLFVMCGFILYDTQLIVEKRRMGSDDYIWHAVELFIDFVNVFRRIMILLANKENNKKRRN